MRDASLHVDVIGRPQHLVLTFKPVRSHTTYLGVAPYSNLGRRFLIRLTINLPLTRLYFIWKIESTSLNPLLI